LSALRVHVASRCAPLFALSVGPFVPFAVLATPSKLASEWFPPQQRTLAVSIAVMSNCALARVRWLPPLHSLPAPAPPALLSPRTPMGLCPPCLVVAVVVVVHDFSVLWGLTSQTLGPALAS
jgi:hypothetical protein